MRRLRAVALIAVAVGVAAAGACDTHSTLDLGGVPPASPTPTATATGTPVAWWDDAFGFRAPVEIAASALVPTSYSVSITVDHASLVAAGHAAADGHDLRVVDDAGHELDRVLDDGSQWNDAATTIWVRTSAAMPADTTTRVWLYYGNASAGAAPADPSSVFLFSDDFESGDLARWDPILNTGSYWTNDTTHARSGTHALRAGTLSGGTRRVIVATAVDADNVAFSAWWFTDAASNVDFSQVVRAHAGTPLYMYKSNFYSGSGWDISKIVADTYTSIAPAHGSLATQTWKRVSVLVEGTREHVVVGANQVTPPSGTTSVGSEIAAGSVGFQDAGIPSGKAIWIDDVVARRYVDPEPVATVGAEEAHP